MKFVKMLSPVAITAATLLVFAGNASATVLTDGAGGTYGVGTVIHANAENTLTLHTAIGDIQCTQSTLEGQIKNTGSTSTTASASITNLTFGNCGASITVLKPGTLEIHTKTASADGNSTLTWTGMETTTVFAGFHCIYTTVNTDIGTLTGSKTKNATLDMEATIPRTGGSAFCGSTAQWTGSYSFTKPTPLYID